MRKTWEHRTPIIKFKVSPRRKRKKEQKPIKRSEYAQSLWNEGGLGGMTNWADELIPQYREGRDNLKVMHKNLTDSEFDRIDEPYINSMIDEMGFSIEWMETGRQPGTLRGVDKRDAYRPKQYDEMDVIPDITEQLEKEREPMNNEIEGVIDGNKKAYRLNNKINLNQLKTKITNDFNVDISNNKWDEEKDNFLNIVNKVNQ